MKRIFFLSFFIFIFQNVQAEEQKLSQAYEQRLLERVKSVFSLEAPKEEVKRPICATPIFVEINFNKHRFSAKTAQLLKPYISRPDFEGDPEYTYDTPSGHFKIHYTRTGTHAVFQADVDVNPADGVPDYVNRCADIFDSVWTKEVDELEYNPPPNDSWYQPNGGDGRYDIYLKNLKWEYYGYSEPETSTVANPISYTSYIVVRNDYSGYAGYEDKLDILRVTAAHEFFHAIQFGYDASEFEFDDPNDQNTYKPYWMEMSAVWMEDMVYDNINDYLGYLSSFFNHPEWSLKTFSYDYKVPDSAYHAYGSCVWPIYLSERFDATIIKDIWEGCADVVGNNAIDYPSGESSIDKALQARGGNFDDAFREFTVWNYFTGNRARTQLFYSEGDMFPQVEVEHLHDFYGTDSVYSPSGPNHPYGLGSNYIVFKPGDKQGGMKLTFSSASPNYNFEISALGYDKDANEPIRHDFQINQQTGFAQTDVYNWTEYDEIVMIPAPVSRNGYSYFPYTYSAIYDSSFHGEKPFPQRDWVGQNFPNPFVINSSADSTFFPFILSSRSDVEINIFALSGELVWQYTEKDKRIDNYTERSMCPAWDGKNQKGEYVATGIYLYQVKTKNSNVIKKMAVIR
ncbi:MAG: hypothetical protein AMJ91_01585 [candidate division Zixibacteria bacterium SM23_73_3]|nr:MAG: hypothetical protein AMJ91_01585 [candidate division Zixibacteria bacterium SM23_73_3]